MALHDQVWSARDNNATVKFSVPIQIQNGTLDSGL